MSKALSIIICSILLFININNTLAQMNDSQLAFKYYNNKEYKKASSLFLEVFELTRSRTYFNYFCRCLIATKDYNKLELILQKEIKANPTNTNYLIELGYMYKISGRVNESNEIYEKIITKIIPHKQSIKNLANSFMYKREYEFALKVLTKGKKIIKEKDAFHLEIANIAYAQKDYTIMIDEYFKALNQDKEKINLIKNRLQSALNIDIDKSLNSLLEKKLIKNIKTNTNKEAFEKLLIWLYIQEKKFSLALLYAQKIDKSRNNTNQIIDIANIALNTKHYDQAIEAFLYIIKKGNTNKLYEKANIGYLKSLNLSYYHLPTNSKKIYLQKQYINFKKVFIANKNNFNTYIDYAHFLAFCLNKEQEAKELLSELETTRGISNKNKSQIKMEKASIILLNGDPYESLLLFSQIEKNNKNNPIGYQAKFKKAKVSYFQGEVKWAKIQLDVLKASTSKLIANDAMLLTQFINDNNNTDSISIPLKKFSYADYLIFQNKYTIAIDSLNSIMEQYPTDGIIDDIVYNKHKIYTLQGLNKKAIEQLEIIKKDFSFEHLIDKSIYQQALLFEEENKYSKAKENYKLLITKYPDSIFTPQARLKYENINNTELNEIKTEHKN